uniref:Uncharacterized protein n=1 Tax=Meloidogyne javanica TaxID=6303 RepID=A0A915MA27_MELJA
MWLVLSDASPGGPPCDYDNPCPTGYKCEDDDSGECCYSGNRGSDCFDCLFPSFPCFKGLYCKYEPKTTTKDPTATTRKKPTPPKPSKPKIN